MVESRCAMTSVVRPLRNSASASCTWRSDSKSRAAVASSSRMIGAFLMTGAGDSDALALPAGKLHTLFADGRIVAGWESAL